MDEMVISDQILMFYKSDCHIIILHSEIITSTNYGNSIQITIQDHLEMTIGAASWKDQNPSNRRSWNINSYPKVKVLKTLK